MLCLGTNAELPELLVELAHKRLDSRLYRAVIVIVELLTFRRTRTEKCAAGEYKIASAIVKVAVDKELFLLGARIYNDAARFVVAKQTEHAKSFAVERLRGAHERRLFIERFAAV